jgi:trimeric autotransporter adhesin
MQAATRREEGESRYERLKGTPDMKHITPVSILLITCVLSASAANAQPPDVVQSDTYNNTAMGTNALLANYLGTDNTGSGASTLINNTNGSDNTALGSNALVANTTGNGNTASGYGALFENSTGSANTAVGINALNLSTGDDNTAIGAFALAKDTSGSLNTATGQNGLGSNTTGVANTATGFYALVHNTTGNNNVAAGALALSANTTGNDNVVAGYEALFSNTTGNDNTASGFSALYSNNIGSGNTASGYDALLKNGAGSNNTALGRAALSANTHGSENIALGYLAGERLTTGNYNIDIGAAGVAGESGAIRIGTPGTQTSAFMAGISGMSGGAAVLVNTSTGQLGFASSSRRYKEDIEPMGDSSERLFKLRPVSFRYKQPNAQGEKPVQFGLIAEEVAQAFPELVLTNSKGQPETVAYHLLPALLLNEVQKEHRRALREDAMLQDAQRVIQKQARALASVELQLSDVNAQVSALRSTLQLTTLNGSDKTVASR